jgi:hypothetical protein
MVDARLDFAAILGSWSASVFRSIPRGPYSVAFVRTGTDLYSCLVASQDPYYPRNSSHPVATHGFQ